MEEALHDVPLYFQFHQFYPGIKRLTEEESKLLKRRHPIEPIIGHFKSDHRMERCHTKGAEGDALHAVLCPAG